MPTDKQIEAACRVHNVGWSLWKEPQKKTAREVMHLALTAAKQAQGAQPVAYGVIASNTMQLCSVYLAKDYDYECLGDYRKEHIVPLYASPTIPEGWQLVPIEPTREMLEAWIDDSSFPSSYRAMLAAAPKPEDIK